MVVTMLVSVFWVLAFCGFVGSNKCLRRMYHLYLQGKMQDTGNVFLKNIGNHPQYPE
jgi:hypothetical protein